MQQNQQNAVEILNKGGAILSSDWTTGHGRYISLRAIPPHCQALPVSESVKLPGETGKNARKLFKAHPRVQKIICVTNRRAVTAWKKG
jgi:hypothetical protein